MLNTLKRTSTIAFVLNVLEDKTIKLNKTIKNVQPKILGYDMIWYIELHSMVEFNTRLDFSDNILHDYEDA